MNPSHGEQAAKAHRAGTHPPERRRWPDTPAWSSATRLWVLTLMVVTAAIIWWHVRQFTTIVVLAVLLAYVLNPLIGRTRRRLGVRRATAAIAVYGVVAIAVVVGSAQVAQSVASSISTVEPERLWNDIVSGVFSALPDEIAFRNQSLVLAPYYEQAQLQLDTDFHPSTSGLLGPSRVGWLLGYATGFATNFVFTAFGLMVTFFVSLYIAMDGDKLLDWIEAKVTPAYRPAYHALRREINGVWRQFFRGQIVLAILIGALTTFGLLLLGVPYALPLGIVAGVLEVVPRLGPVLSVAPAMAVALVLPSSTLPELPRVWFVVLVAVLYIVIQNLENSLLAPRILGSSVNLPPAVVLIGALGGAAVGGVPGIFLAAPVLGSGRVIGSWLYDQLTRPVDAPPEALPAPAAAEPDEPPPGSHVRRPGDV